MITFTMESIVMPDNIPTDSFFMLKDELCEHYCCDGINKLYSVLSNLKAVGLCLFLRKGMWDILLGMLGIVSFLPISWDILLSLYYFNFFLTQSS